MPLESIEPPGRNVHGVVAGHLELLAHERHQPGDIYRSILPFVALEAIGLVLIMLFPELCLWLPDTMLG